MTQQRIMDDGSKDRRQFPRIAAEHTVLIESVDHSTTGFARTQVVALGGCGFLTRETLDLGDELDLLVTLGGRILRVRARTVYTRSAPDGRNEVGVEFLEISEEDLRLLEGALVVEA
jgi:hypothetical protein